MYLRELVIQNAKLLRDVTISFLRGGQPRKWTVLLGENGLCKTTILQAIALAASGVDRANRLGEITSLPDRRLPSPEVTIRAEFSFAPEHDAKRTYPGLESPRQGSPRLRSELRVPPGWNVFEGTSTYLG